LIAIYRKCTVSKIVGKKQLESNYTAFDPVLVFQIIYKKTFTEIRTTFFLNNNTNFLQIQAKIQDMFCKQVLDNIDKSTPTVSTYRTVLAQFRQ
jgi:hypothetical protein